MKFSETAKFCGAGKSEDTEVLTNLICSFDVSVNISMYVQQANSFQRLMIKERKWKVLVLILTPFEPQLSQNVNSKFNFLYCHVREHKILYENQLSN